MLKEADSFGKQMFAIETNILKRLHKWQYQIIKRRNNIICTTANTSEYIPIKDK